MGSVHADGADADVTGLTRLRVASRSASSAPKNSVKARTNPVIEANSRNSVAGKAIQRCHFLQKAVFSAMKGSVGASRPEGTASLSRTYHSDPALRPRRHRGTTLT